MGKIVVGMDTSPGAATALRWGAREGELRGWEVTAVMAWSYLDQAHKGPGGRSYSGYSEVAVAAQLDEAVVQAVGPDSASGIRRQVVIDLPAPGLLSATEDADLLVVGARGLGGFRSLLLGSVSEQCLHHATCPIAVVRSTALPEPGATSPEDDDRERIVVGIDGSPHAQHALRWAIAKARARQAMLEAVYAWRLPAVGVSPSICMPASDTIEEESRRILTEAVSAEDPTLLPAPVEQTVLCGPPGRVILEASKGADLIVTGSRGRASFKGLLLGSSSHQVARHAACPVVVISFGSRS